MSSLFNAHLTQVLAKNRLSEDKLKRFKEARQEIVEYLEKKFGADITIIDSGSIAKGTAIDTSDMDISVCFKKNYPHSIKPIYGLIHEVLEQKFTKPEQVAKKRVALRVEIDSDISVDVIPCQWINNTHIRMYNVMQSKRQRGSIRIHVVNARQYRQIIKLMKIWRKNHNKFEVNGKKLNGFALELLVIRALNRQPQLDYTSSFIRVLLYLKGCINSIKLVDPANHENTLIISDQVRQEVKKIATECYNSYKQKQWKAIID
jgi:tRNA nucleotidyltransferase (CCA-adding enzyme)